MDYTIYIRFNQETMDMIQNMGNILIIIIKKYNDTSVLSTALDLNSSVLKTDINLFNHKTNTLKSMKN